MNARQRELVEQEITRWWLGDRILPGDPRSHLTPHEVDQVADLAKRIGERIQEAA